MESKLMPCKGCGDQHVHVWTIDYKSKRKYMCECTKCNIKTKEHPTRSKSIQEWNKIQEDTE